MKKIKNNYLYSKRLKFLKYAKPYISEKGLTNDIFKKISNLNGLDVKEIEILFPEGNSDLIQFALYQLANELENYCKKIDLIRLPIHKRIRIILLSKINLMNKEKIFYKKIFLNLFIPQKNFSLTSQIYNSVDQMWFIAGDLSVDFNFYTKRLILSGIYLRIILFFFNNDNQKGLEDLLDENLKRVSKIPEIKSKFNIFKEYFPKFINIVRNSN